VSSAAKDGIFASGSSKLEMVLARITSCKGKGINSASSELNISTCTFTKNKDDAVFVASGKITINSCKITQNSRRGIVVKKASVTANANKVYKNGSAELYFASGAKGKFRLNTIGGGGISVAKSSNINFIKSTYRISEGTLTIKKKSYKYTGKAICPKVTVKFGGKKLSEDDYKVTYTNNKKRGTATVKITGKGEYKGTLTANFTIK
jgi:hypothetical protein